MRTFHHTWRQLSARGVNRLITLVGTCLVCLSIGPAASAQEPPSVPASAQRQAAPAPSAPRRTGKWLVEFHGGQFLDAQTTGGSGSGIASFPTGTPFTTVNGLPSRAVSSWAYGDGPVFFDEVRRSFAANLGLTLPGITPLDAVMRVPGTVRKPGPTFGARFSRDLTPWLALELSVDRGAAKTSLADDVTAGLEATRASYTSAFEALLATIPQNGGRVAVTKTASNASSGQQTIATASAVLTFVRSSRVRAHAVVGGGYVMKDGAEALEMSLTSSYRFSVFSTFPINESESVTVRYSEKKSAPLVTLGLGFSVRVAGQSGVRVDARVLASENRAVTTVSSSNARVVAPQLVSFPSLTTPSIQFNTAAGTRTTLSGDAVNDLVTYRGSGYDLRPHLTVGYFVRF